MGAFSNWVMELYTSESNTIEHVRFAKMASSYLENGQNRLLGECG